RLPKVLSTTSLFGPTRVSKLELRLINDRRGIGWHFGGLRITIRLHERQPLASADLEFVERALIKIWDEEFPNTRRTESTHLVEATVPTVEIADDANSRGMRRPDSK